MMKRQMMNDKKSFCLKVFYVSSKLKQLYYQNMHHI